jgi:hypothetical protein
MIAAVFLKLTELDWHAAVQIADTEDRLIKGGFDPNEPRSQAGRWTGGGDERETRSSLPGFAFHSEAESTASDLFNEIAYQGEFHDILVEDWAEHLRSLGATVLT